MKLNTSDRAEVYAEPEVVALLEQQKQVGASALFTQKSN